MNNSSYFQGKQGTCVVEVPLEVFAAFLTDTAARPIATTACLTVRLLPGRRQFRRHDEALPAQKRAAEWILGGFWVGKASSFFFKSSSFREQSNHEAGIFCKGLFTLSGCLLVTIKTRATTLYSTAKCKVNGGRVQQASYCMGKCALARLLQLPFGVKLPWDST